MKKIKEKLEVGLDLVAAFCHINLMSMLRDTILKRMEELGLTTYRLSKMVEGKVPQRTVYAFISGEFDASSEVVSALMKVLGLGIKVNKTVKRGRHPRKEK